MAAGTVDAAGFSVAYVMTDYPRLAMTFITDEIDEIRRRGGTVVTFSMNRPSAADVAGPDGRERAADTVYLKASPLSLLGAVAAVGSRDPAGMLRAVRAAMRSAGAEPVRVLRRLAHLAYAARVLEDCRRAGLRHVHAHFAMAPATIAWFVGLLSDGDVTWSATVHGSDVGDPAETRMDLKAADAAAIFCVSDFTRSQVLRQVAPRWWDRVRVVRCGLDLQRFSTRPPTAGSETDAVVTTVARLAPEKGHVVLIDAAARLRDRFGIRARFDIVGDGPLRGAIEEAIAERSLEDRVRLLGELQPDEVARRLEDSTVFCLPSFVEGIPVALMEAMAVGVPVVASHVGGVPELAIDRVSALTVPPADAEALAAALADVIGDPEAAAVRARRGVELVRERHDRTTCATVLIGELRRAASGPVAS